MEGAKLEAIIEDGIHGQVVLIGFPYDEGVIRAGGRRGAELGPDCTRRFLPKIGPIINTELNISLAGLKLTDYGNIVQDTFEDAHQKLETKLITVLNKPQSPVAVVVGGGSDQSYSTVKGFAAYCGSTQKHPVVVSVSSGLGVGVSPESGLASGCQFRALMELETYQTQRTGFYAFGIQGNCCVQSDLQYVTKQGGSVTWLSAIRDSELYPKTQELPYRPKTQAGTCFHRLLSSLSPTDSVLLSFNLNAINSAFCPGVCTPSVTGGFTSEEAIEIALLAGICAQVKVLDISEFSPAIEDFRTGRLVSSLIYSLLLGHTKRN